MIRPDAVLAAIQADVLVRCFVVASVVVVPFWLHRRRKAQRLRRTVVGASTTTADQPDVPRLEDVISGIGDLAAAARSNGSAIVELPVGLTVDGTEVDGATVDALVRDALRRSGLAAVSEIDGPAGRTLECRPITAPDPPTPRSQR